MVVLLVNVRGVLVCLVVVRGNLLLVLVGGGWWVQLFSQAKASNRKS